jgi:hypothetical protein
LINGAITPAKLATGSVTAPAKRQNAALLTDLADLKAQVQQVNATFKSLKNSAPQAVKLSASGKFRQP